MADDDDRHRLDRWLWFARFYKTRSLATQAVSGGRVKLNGQRVKPSHEVRPGDRLTLVLERETFEVDVNALPTRRGPAPEAQSQYVETPESVAARDVRREQRRIAALQSPEPDSRPDKRERRALDRLRRGQS